MVKRIFQRGKRFITSPSSSIFSAATVIMLMIVLSKILGFIRQRTLFTYFAPEQTDLFLAAFELPDLIFEVFVFGVLSASLIPVLSRYVSKGKTKDAWKIVATSLNAIGLLFLFLSVVLFVFARPLYTVLAGGLAKDVIGIGGGFTSAQVDMVVALARIILGAQIFFLVSTFMTGILETHKHFLIPAVAPVFYNLGIILATIFLSPRFGLYAPTIGAVMGAFGHMAIQLPFVFRLGFRPRFVLDFGHPGVRKLIKLASPRVIELSFLQIRRFVWLFLASTMAGGFTFLRSADLLQTLPIGVFGMSIAKATLPTLSEQSSKGDVKGFRHTFTTTLNQVLFLVVPFSVFLAVLRVPVVRLIFGAERFDWEATVNTGQVLSAFAIGTFAYAGTLVVTRGYYALQDTKTPVIFSVLSIFVNAVLGFVFVVGQGLGVWGIALAYSISGILQFFTLLGVLIKRIKVKATVVVVPFLKTLIASVASGSAVYVLLKVFDRSVWVKRLSFLSSLESLDYIPFQKFVLDTRYTANLLALTGFVTVVGALTYFVLSMLLKSEEVWRFLVLAKRFGLKRRSALIKDTESVTPLPTE